MDEHLSFTCHSKVLRSKLGRAAGMLYKTRNVLDTLQLKTLYCAIFHSHISYGCQIWGQIINVHTEKIFTIQNKAMRALTFSGQRVSSKPLYSQMNILNREDYIKLQNILFVMSSLNKSGPSCFQNYFRIAADQHTYNTRSSSIGCLHASMQNTIIYGLNSITSKCVSDWNAFTAASKTHLFSLPPEQVKMTIISHFLETYRTA